MRTNYLFWAALLVSNAVWAQSLTIDPAPGTYLNGRQPEEGAIFVREVVIFSEDFSDGIPSDWTQETDNSPAAWEYRGPSTNPSNLAGTRGSCVSTGNTYGPPIESPTADNGFVIFDSNYWDDNIGPCGNFGAGPAPGPHYATLVTPVMDLSDYPSVGVRFNQFMKNFQAETRLECKVAGSDWQIVWENDVAGNNAETPKDRFDRFNVSDIAGGQSGVQFRFVFEGNYYYWMIDDFEVFELLQNNLHIESSTYGNFDIENAANETGFEWMEYSMYPLDMAPRVFFRANTWNWGASAQTNCILQADLRNESTMDTIFSGATNPITLADDQFTSLGVPFHQLEPEMAPYTVHLHVSQTEEEEAPDDNRMIHQFEVSDVTYARDRLETEGIFVPNPTYNGSPYEVGNFFVITADDQAVESLSIGIGLGSDPSASVYGKIYKLSISGQGLNATMVAETDEFGITQGAYNNVGDNNVMTIPFPAPVSLMRDSAYLVVAGTNDGPESVLFPVSGDSPDLTSMVRFFPNSWFYLVRTPLVRMNFGPVVNVQEVENPDFEFIAYPNPTNNHLNVAYELTQASEVQFNLFDQTGRVVWNQEMGRRAAGEYLDRLPLDALPAGWYVLSLQTSFARTNEMIMIRP